MDRTPVLNWNIAALLAAHDLNPSRLAQAAEIHPYTIGQMAKNATSRVSLETLARLARALGCAVATAPSGAVGTPWSPPLLCWTAEGILRWNLTALMDAQGLSVKDLYFRTAIERSALSKFHRGDAAQASIFSLETLCRFFAVPLAGPPPGVTSAESLLVWADARAVPADEPPVDETPIADAPSRVCKGPVCKALHPEGVEKRIDAFPVSKAYAHGRGPVCKACRRHQEQQRRQRRKATK